MIWTLILIIKKRDNCVTKLQGFWPKKNTITLVFIILYKNTCVLTLASVTNQ